MAQWPPPLNTPLGLAGAQDQSQKWGAQLFSGTIYCYSPSVCCAPPDLRVGPAPPGPLSSYAPDWFGPFLVPMQGHHLWGAGLLPHFFTRLPLLKVLVEGKGE